MERTKKRRESGKFYDTKINPTADSGYLRISNYFIPKMIPYLIGKTPTCYPAKYDSGRGVVTKEFLLMPIINTNTIEKEQEVFNIFANDSFVANGMVVR